jgi:meiotically up-regulated gene 157 (Mug157) protein
MAKDVLDQVVAGITQYGIVESEDGPIYAYEVPPPV